MIGNAVKGSRKKTVIACLVAVAVVALGVVTILVATGDIPFRRAQNRHATFWDDSIVCNTSEVKPKTIWVFWSQGEHNYMASPLRRRIRKLWETTLPEWNVTIVSLSNIHRYLPRNTLPLKYFTFENKAHMADIARVALMARFGGIYADSSLIPTPTATQAFETMWRELHSPKNSEVQVLNTKNWQNKCKWELGMWLFVGKRDSIFMRDWNRNMLTVIGNRDTVEDSTHSIIEDTLARLQRSEDYDCPNPKQSIPVKRLRYLSIGWLLQFKTEESYKVDRPKAIRHIRARCNFDDFSKSWKDEFGQTLNDDVLHWFSDFPLSVACACYIDPSDPFMADLGLSELDSPVFKVMGAGESLKDMTQAQLDTLSCDTVPHKWLNVNCKQY